LISTFLFTALACGPNRMTPDQRTADTCPTFTGCGECVGQPHCGWCVTDGVGRCVANRGETEPAEPPEACAPPGTWHYLIRDDQSLPDGAPYCPPVAAPETSGHENADEATLSGEEEAL